MKCDQYASKLFWKALEIHFLLPVKSITHQIIEKFDSLDLKMKTHTTHAPSLVFKCWQVEVWYWWLRINIKFLVRLHDREGMILDPLVHRIRKRHKYQEAKVLFPFLQIKPIKLVNLGAKLWLGKCFSIDCVSFSSILYIAKPYICTTLKMTVSAQRIFFSKLCLSYFIPKIRFQFFYNTYKFMALNK